MNKRLYTTPSGTVIDLDNINMIWSIEHDEDEMKYKFAIYFKQSGRVGSVINMTQSYENEQQKEEAKSTLEKCRQDLVKAWSECLQ